MEELSAEQSCAGLVSSTSLSIVKDSGHLTWVMLHQPQEQRYPFLLACTVFSCLNTGLASSFGIVNIHSDVDVYDCTWGCANTIRESALEVDWKENPLSHQGLKTQVNIATGFSVQHSTN